MSSVVNIKQGRRPVHKATFKFRWECQIDVFTFFTVLTSHLVVGVVSLRMEKDDIITFTVASTDANRISLDSMRRAAACGVDCHYILESINTPEKFTGDRYYHVYSEQTKVCLSRYIRRLKLPPLEEIKLLPSSGFELPKE